MSIKRILVMVATAVIIGMFINTLLTSNVYAAGNCAFSVGGNFVNNPLNIEDAVLNAKTYYSNMGYNSYYSTYPTQSIVNGYFQNGTRRLESDIVFFAGHGNYQAIEQSDNVGLSVVAGYGNYARTSNFNWGNTRLVTIMGCHTGQETSASYVNIAYDIWARSGYTNSTLGWRQSIYDTDIKKWANRYNYRLSTGANIRTSIDYANGYNDYISNSIKDLAFYGSWSSTFRRTASMVYGNIRENNLIVVDENIEFNENDINSINTIMSKKITGFNIDDFEISIFDLDSTNKNYTIDLQYKINDCYTNQGYVIEVEDGKICRIKNNMNKNVQSKSIINTNVSEEKIRECKKNATNELIQKISTKDKENLKIVSQNVKKVLEDNTLKIIILTEYNLKNNTTGGITSEYII